MVKASYVRFETPGDLVEKIYEAIEKARASGRIIKGTNEVTKAIERGQAKFVAIAEDVQPPEVVMHIPLLCEEKKIEYGYVSSKQELGNSAGLMVGTASIAIAEEGEEKKLLSEIIERVQGIKGEKKGEAKNG